MKRIKSTCIVAMLLSSIFYFGCQPQADVPGPQSDILPEQFGVNIPDALSSQYGMSNGRTAAVDTLKGNEIYQHLNLFINVGEEAANIVGDIIRGIKIYHINKPMSLSYDSDDDGRTKNLVVKENPTYDGQNWEFMLTITDAASESAPDGGKGLQIFWNRHPVKGVAILKPVNIDMNTDFEFGQAMFRIDYSEAGEHGYESDMIVSIADLPLADPLEDPYSMSALKMFAGKEGDIIDVYGNSDHPNAVFFSGNAGFDWAFVASGSDSKNIGVAEVGLPPSNLDETSRETLLKYYSIKNVLTREITKVWPGIDQSSLDAYLYNAGAPGYFNANGFVAGGTSPSEDYNSLESRINLLNPYNPKEVANLTISFQ